MDLITPLIAFGVVAVFAGQQARANREAARRRQLTEAHQRQVARERARVLSPDRAWAAAESAGWDRMLAAGRLRLIGAAATDPGNAGNTVRLVEATDGSLGDVRVLLATDGTPGSDGTHAVVAIAVPSWLTDPLQAAAWTYDDASHPLRTTAAAYAELDRRT